MRARTLIPVVAVVVLLVAGAAACGSEEPGAGSETETPSPSEPAMDDAGSGWQTVDVQAADDALSADAQAQLVDVREPEEWAETGVPAGAVLIPLGELQSRAAAELDAARPVYVLCRTGNRSQTGSDILVGMGFTDVFNVDGGIVAWTAAGLPVEDYRP
jgi:rhodanese-related sulfurtransferase